MARLSQKNFERHAAAVKLGLTLEQCKVLFYLQRNQGINQKRLAYLSDTDQMTLVRTLDRMEKDGWIERYADPQDRRAWRLRLKPAATPVLKQIWIIADRARAEWLAGLDTTERDLLLSLLQRIRGNLAALMPGAIEPDQACCEEPEPA
ncbi:MAG TPA: MarR family transcriptional regulator, partial [Burkholderiaceae bacterium]|nr:MarR family transcriptional regulator [Burkholderiaceae bacterium]